MKTKHISVIVLVLLITLCSCKKEEETAYSDLKVSVSEMSLTEGDTQKATITSGSDFYTVSSSDPSKVKAGLNKNIVTVTAIAEGNSKIVITDSKTKQTQTINVVVKVAIPDLAISKSELTFEAGQTITTTITAGSGDYTASSSDDSKVTVKLENGIITITGVTEGTVKLTIKDNKTGQSKEIAITITAKTSNLSISQSEFTITLGQTATTTITEGSGDYSVSSNDVSKATAKLENGIITITSVSKGIVKLTVKDNKSEQTQEIEIIITAKPSNLSISQSEFTITLGQTATTTITAGSGDYSVSSNDDSKATAKLENGVITITSVSEGIVKLTVKDNKSEQTQEIEIIITAKPSNLSISQSEFTITLGQTATTTITAGSGDYFVSSNDDSKATAKLENGVITITSVSEGTVKLTVKDNKTEQTQEIAVRIEIKKLLVASKEVYIEKGKTSKIAIESGSDSYKVNSEDKSIAKVKLTGSIISIKGEKEGRTNLIITDIKTQQTKTIKVLVTPKVPNFSLSHRKITMFINSKPSFVIHSGSGNFKVETKDPSVATVSKFSNEVYTIKGMAIGTTYIEISDLLKPTVVKRIEITVRYAKLSLSRWSTSVEAGSRVKIDIREGNGKYEIQSENDNIAIATIQKGKVIIIGVTEGTTKIAITDLESKETELINVNVSGSSPSGLIVEEHLNVTVGQNISSSIISGSGSYTVSSSDISKVIATVSGNVISVTGVAGGTAALTVTDVNTNESKEIRVNISSETVPYVSFVTNKSAGETIEISISVFYENNAWIDLNNNGVKDSGEEVTTIGEKVSYTLGSSNIQIHGDISMLRIDGQGITSIDMSENKNLTWLSCQNNSLSNLNLLGNKKLKYLVCNDNQLTSLALPIDTEMQMLVCKNNQLNYLDISNSTRLAFFDTTGNLSLSCIKVTDVQKSNIPIGWHKDSTATYNTSCP